MATTMTDDERRALLMATVLGERHMGLGQGEAFGKRNVVPSELLVRLRRQKTIALAGIAG